MANDAGTGQCEEWCATLSGEAARLRRFELVLDVPTPRGVSIDHVINQVFERTLGRLIAQGVTEGWVTGLKKELAALDDVTARNAAQVRDWSGRYLRPGRGAAAIDMDSARGDIEFWGWLARGGVSGELRLVLVTDERRAAIVDMFAAGRNPTMIWNIRAVLNAELLNFAKQKSVKVGKVALVVHNASLPVTVSVFAPSKRIPILLQQAFEHATLSAEYVRDNCVPRVRPIERVDWDYFRAVQTRGAVVFRNAIKRGMARPKDPKVQWPALASVELIAAIGGRPPQVFDEADRSLDAEVHKWLRKPPTIDADLKESAIVYLKRLRKNAPSVAKLTWETDGARNAWLGALDDLNRRLGSGST